MAMKIFCFAFILMVLYSCHNGKNIPDVSAIKVNIQLERFEKDFFAIDTNDISGGLIKIKQQYPGFYFDFMREILGVDGVDSSLSTITATHSFLQSYFPIYDSLILKYDKLDWLKTELENDLKFVKYYFPEYKIGNVVTFIGPFDSPGTALTQNGFAIGLQQFAGKDFSVYQAPQMLEMFPTYISRRFDAKYISVNCIKLVIDELFPDNSRGKALIEQMIEKGKQWYLLDKFLPNTADSLKTGYTGLQLEWCRNNEGLIWSTFLKNEDLNSIDPVSIQNYIGEAPFTQGFSQEASPGNLGQWIGWRIVQKFADKNPDMKPREVMQTEARKILEMAKYKPR